MGLEDKKFNSIKEFFRKVRECEAEGHPFEDRVIIPYQGGSSKVFTKCTGCGWQYDRYPTGEEIRQYEEMLNLRINI